MVLFPITLNTRARRGKGSKLFLLILAHWGSKNPKDKPYFIQLAKIHEETFSRDTQVKRKNSKEEE